MGTGVAWIYSVVGTLIPALFPTSMRSTDGSVAIYFEAAAVITVLVVLGQVLELRAREPTSGAIRALRAPNGGFCVPKSARARLFSLAQSSNFAAEFTPCIRTVCGVRWRYRR
jgi:cation transport ATPase